MSINNIGEFVKAKCYLNTNLLITDNNYIEIENCKKILEFNDVYLKIRTSNLILEIWGKELYVSDFNTDGIIIRGIISSIEFHKMKK